MLSSPILSFLLITCNVYIFGITNVNGDVPCDQIQLKCPFGDTVNGCKSSIGNCEYDPTCTGYNRVERADGCSSPILQDDLNGAFWPACNMHDACYSTLGVNKETCDDQFLTNMNHICWKLGGIEYPVCISTASIMHDFVSSNHAASFGRGENQKWAHLKCKDYIKREEGCNQVWNYDPELGSAQLPNGRNQVPDQVYKVGDKCYRAKTSCYGCLNDPDNHPFHLEPIDCNECCNVVYNYDVLGSKSLVNNGNCWDDPCNQVPNRIYKKGGKCYRAITGCDGCIKNPDAHPGHLKPIACNECPVEHVRRLMGGNSTESISNALSTKFYLHFGDKFEDDLLNDQDLLNEFISAVDKTLNEMISNDYVELGEIDGFGHIDNIKQADDDKFKSIIKDDKLDNYAYLNIKFDLYSNSDSTDLLALKSYLLDDNNTKMINKAIENEVKLGGKNVFGGLDFKVYFVNANIY